MNVAASAVTKRKIGTCPHGLPQGACPICSGMGGGGGSAKKTDSRAGEMSWDECYAVWQQMIRAKEMAQRKKELAQNQNIQAPISFASKFANGAEKIANLIQKLTNFSKSQDNLPKIIAKPLAIAAKIAIPVLNLIKNVAIIANKALNFIQTKFTDISDKLNAIFGELKNSIEEKISERFKNAKKKFKSIFGIYEPEYVDDDEKKIEEAKKQTKLKTLLHNIKEKFKRN